MRKIHKNLGLTLCSLVMALALVFGIGSLNVRANNDPSVVMHNGASVRIDEGNPALVYTATVENYNKDLTYGMLFVEESVLKINSITENYIANIESVGASYQNAILTPYQTAEETYEMRGFFDVAMDKISVNYVAIAYVQTEDAIIYGEVNKNHARSVEYVSAAALTYGDGDEDVLSSFVSAEILEEISSSDKDKLVISDGAIYVPQNTYMNVVVDNLNQGDYIEGGTEEQNKGSDGSTSLSLVTAKKYDGGSVLTFDVFVPTEIENSRENFWVAVVWGNRKSDLNSIYAWAEDSTRGVNVTGQITVGEWSTVSVTLPAGDENYYVSIVANKGSWNDGTGNETEEEKENLIHYAMGIDNVKFGDTVEDFEDELIDIFTVSGNDSKEIAAEDVVYLDVESSYMILGAEPIYGEFAMQFVFNATDLLSVITKNAYAGGSTVSFKYYIPEGTEVLNGWWGIAWHNDASMAHNYHTAGIETGYIGHQTLSRVVGAWTNVEFTLPAGGPWYLYFGSDCGSNWMLNGENSYVLIDDFKVGDTLETFNGGLEKSIFKSLQPTKVFDSADGAGHVVEEFKPGEHAMKYVFNEGGESITFVSKDAYAGGSTVSLKYYIPEGTVTSWWRVSYDVTPSIDFYHSPFKDLSAVVGAWTDATFTLPDGGPYYITITSEVGRAHGRWMVDGECSYALIDNVTIGDVTEDFYNGLESSMFTVLNPAAVKLGEGYVEEAFEPGEYAAKLYFNNSFDYNATTFITKQAYAGGSTVTFKYMIPAETTIGDWWAIGWDTNNTNPDFYSVGKGNAAPVGGINPTGGNKTSGTGWVEYSFTLPASDTPFYIFFVGYQNWNGYVYIDDFKVGDVVETFNDGLEDSIFAVNNSAYVTLGDGYTEGEFGARIRFDLISGTATTPSFITKEAYTLTEPTVVSFDYFMEGHRGAAWWSLCWTDDNINASVYAHAETKRGITLPVSVQNEWATVSVEIPAGTWYFYIGASIGDWGRKDGEEGAGNVIIDNFTIGGELIENFNNGTDYGAFLDNRDSKPNAITIADGKEEFKPGEYAMKLYAKAGGVVSNASVVAFPAGSTVSFKYFIPEEFNPTWWRTSYTTYVPSKESYTDYYNAPFVTNGTVKGAWTTFEMTLPTEGESYYIFFVTSEGEWGDGAYVLIDDVTVTAPDGTVTKENFNNGFNGDCLFELRTSLTTLADGYVSDQPEVEDPEIDEPEVEEPEVVVTFDSLLADGTIHEYLADEKRVSVKIDATLSTDNLADGALLANLFFVYEIEGDRAFALVLSDNAFLYFNGGDLSLYVDGSLVNTVVVDGFVDLMVKADGSLVVCDTNGVWIHLGEASVEEFKFVSLFGEGDVYVYALTATIYA